MKRKFFILNFNKNSVIKETSSWSLSKIVENKPEIEN